MMISNYSKIATLKRKVNYARYNARLVNVGIIYTNKVVTTPRLVKK